MNPWNPCDDLYFQISSSSADYSSIPTNQTSSSAAEDHHHHQILVHEYEYGPAMVVDAGASVPPCPNQKGTGKGKQRKGLTPNNNALGAEDDYENKKLMHRETEKQRRQEMARLCTTFRTLLPFEYIKGKRSTSDHMLEGVKYIKHLENRVVQLEAKRDELVKLTNLRPKSSGSSSSASTKHVHHHHPTYVIVEPLSSGGVLIKCSYSFRNYAFPLSGILDIVLKQGLNVVNCTSITTDDHRFIHTIRSEGPELMTTETDYTELQRKLNEAISSSSN